MTELSQIMSILDIGEDVQEQLNQRDMPEVLLEENISKDKEESVSCDTPFNETLFRNSLNQALMEQYSSPRKTRSSSKNYSNSPIKTENRRCLTKPCKLTKTDDIIKNIYLSKSTKFAHKQLETIFENPMVEKGNLMFLGKAKVRRYINLNREFRTVSKTKSILRKKNIKKFLTKNQKQKLTHEMFSKKMEEIENLIDDLPS